VTLPWQIRWRTLHHPRRNRWTKACADRAGYTMTYKFHIGRHSIRLSDDAMIYIQRNIFPFSVETQSLQLTFQWCFATSVRFVTIINLVSIMSAKIDKICIFVHLLFPLQQSIIYSQHYLASWCTVVNFCHLQDLEDDKKMQNVFMCEPSSVKSLYNAPEWLKW